MGWLLVIHFENVIRIVWGTLWRWSGARVIVKLFDDYRQTTVERPRAGERRGACVRKNGDVCWVSRRGFLYKGHFFFIGL